MAKAFMVMMVAVVALMGYLIHKHEQSKPPSDISAPSPLSESPRPRTIDVARSVSSTPEYRCDGRTHCSQMSSCDEATFFLKNCPNTKMDGDNDGIPCEQQLC